MKKNYLNIYLIKLILILSVSSLFSQVNPKIIISKGSGHPAYLNYINWMNKHYPDVEVIDVYAKDINYIDSVLNISSGLLLSGGVDVHPGRFGKAEQSDKCEIDLMRDTIEFHLIENALKNKMPILGVCRGMQMMNVATGGSLIVDIPSEVKKHLDHQNGLPEDSYHRVEFEASSYISKILNSKEEIVNSNHHQSVDKLGKNIRVSSKTSDGIIESIEWLNPENKSWFIGVQWHPERLINSNASVPILKEFISKSNEYKEMNKK